MCNREKRFMPGQKLELTPQKIFQTRIHFGGMSRTISLMKLSISTGLSNTANVAISTRYDIFRLKPRFDFIILGERRDSAFHTTSSYFSNSNFKSNPSSYFAIVHLAMAHKQYNNGRCKTKNYLWMVLSSEKTTRRCLSRHRTTQGKKIFFSENWFRKNKSEKIFWYFRMLKSKN